jgi:hypothetical protein
VGEDGENPEFHTHQGSSKKKMMISSALLRKREREEREVRTFLP